MAHGAALAGDDGVSGAGALFGWSVVRATLERDVVLIGGIPGGDRFVVQDAGVQQHLLGALGDGPELPGHALEGGEVGQGAVAGQDGLGFGVSQPGTTIRIDRVNLGDGPVALGGMLGDQVFGDAGFEACGKGLAVHQRGNEVASGDRIARLARRLHQRGQGLVAEVLRLGGEPLDAALLFAVHVGVGRQVDTALFQPVLHGLEAQEAVLNSAAHHLDPRHRRRGHLRRGAGGDGETNIPLGLVKPLRKRNDISSVVAGDGISGFDLIGVIDNIFNNTIG